MAAVSVSRSRRVLTDHRNSRARARGKKKKKERKRSLTAKASAKCAGTRKFTKYNDEAVRLQERGCLAGRFAVVVVEEGERKRLYARKRERGR